MAQPHKGNRHQVATRITTSEFNKLNAYVDFKGMTKNDFIREVLVDALEKIELNALHEDQEQLPITA